MIRPVNTEMTVMNEEVYGHRSLETGSGPHGEAPGLVRRQRGVGEMWTRIFTVVSVGRNG